jgi:Cytosol aminopeptidase family, N-terminal domain
MKPIFAPACLSVLLLWPACAQPLPISIPGAPMPIQVLAQSPAETTTDLQVICLFRSSPENTLHGSLTEINEKMKGLLDRIRKPELFRGELGETLVIMPPPGTLGARNLLIIGLGDSQGFTPPRMQLAGEILFSEAARIGAAHPFFAPTILDGGVSKFATGDVAEQVVGGFLRATALDRLLRGEKAAGGTAIEGLTFLAGVKNVDSTRAGIEKAIAAAARK